MESKSSSTDTGAIRVRTHHGAIAHTSRNITQRIGFAIGEGQTTAFMSNTFFDLVLAAVNGINPTNFPASVPKSSAKLLV